MIIQRSSYISNTLYVYIYTYMSLFIGTVHWLYILYEVLYPLFFKNKYFDAIYLLIVSLKIPNCESFLTRLLSNFLSNQKSKSKPAQ
jgi:hypothetical protein